MCPKQGARGKRTGVGGFTQSLGVKSSVVDARLVLYMPGELLSCSSARTSPGCPVTPGSAHLQALAEGVLPRVRWADLEHRGDIPVPLSCTKGVGSAVTQAGASAVAKCFQACVGA